MEYEFGSGDWDLGQGKVVEHLGRQALMGTAYLSGLTFENGVIKVDIAKYYPRNSRVGDCILGRAFLEVEKDTLLRLGFGYSDFITIYLNKEPVFFGNSAYRSRDNSFLGIVVYFDNLFLPLKKGNNELLVQLGESMGGWAFCFREEDEVYSDPSITKRWELKDSVAIPECVVYDPVNKVCYVSNYFNEGNEFISKISLDGKVLSREWITGVVMPTGMALAGRIERPERPAGGLGVHGCRPE